MIRSFSFGRIRPWSSSTRAGGRRRCAGVRPPPRPPSPGCGCLRRSRRRRRTPGGRRRPRRARGPRRRRDPAAVRAAIVADRAAAGGQLVEHRDIEIAVVGQGERPRDRRRRHDQDVDVARALARQRHALVQAEPVLLVDHRQAEIGERHAFLDERVRADHQIERSVGRGLQRSARGLRRSRCPTGGRRSATARLPPPRRTGTPWSVGSAARARNGTAPVRRSSSSAVTERRCWPARTSVGAMIAA